MSPHHVQIPIDFFQTASFVHANISRSVRGEGHDAPKGATVLARFSRSACDGETRKAHRLAALHLRDFWRRDRSSGCGIRKPCELSFIRADFAALQPHRVQPPKAEPLSWPGRRPSTSRTHVCETCARARLPPHFKTPHEAPLVNGIYGLYSYIGFCQDAAGNSLHKTGGGFA